MTLNKDIGQIGVATAGVSENPIDKGAFIEQAGKIGMGLAGGYQEASLEKQMQAGDVEVAAQRKADYDRISEIDQLIKNSPDPQAIQDYQNKRQSLVNKLRFGADARMIQAKLDAELRSAIAKTPWVAPELRAIHEGQTGAGQVVKQYAQMGIDLEKRMLQTNMDEELAAQQHNMSVTQWRQANQILTDGKVADANLSIMSTQSKVNYLDVSEQIGKASGQFNLDFGNDLMTAVKAGGFSPEQRNNLMARSELYRRQMYSKIDGIPGILASERKALKDQVDSNISAVKSISDDMDLSKTLAKIVQMGGDAVKIQNMIDYPTIVKLKDLGGPQLVTYYVQSMGNDRFLNAIKTINPGMYNLFTNNDTRAKAISGLISSWTNGELRQKDPATANAITSMAVTDPSTPPDVKDKGFQDLSEAIKTQPMGWNVYLHPVTVSEVYRDPKKQAILKNDFNQLVFNLKSNLADSPLDLTKIKVLYDKNGKYLGVDARDARAAYGEQHPWKSIFGMLGKSPVYDIDTMMKIYDSYGSIVAPGKTPEQFIRETFSNVQNPTAQEKKPKE